jgi:peptide/nickel transport system permease protein
MLEGYAYADSVEALRRELGLDKPMHIQYLERMSALLRGDLGHSLWTKESIVTEFARRFPVTLELALLTIIVSVTFGVGVGVLSAVRQESWLDYIGRVVAILALAMPYFWLAILVVVLPAIYFRSTPLWTYVPLTTDPLENLKILIFPALVFGVSRAGPIMRDMRSSMLEVQRQDYIRTAWAKGLPECRVIFKHAIKNALIRHCSRETGLYVDMRGQCGVYGWLHHGCHGGPRYAKTRRIPARSLGRHHAPCGSTPATAS